ncbi:PilW family protein [Pyxidicoccus sp. 3LG]
MSQSLPKRSRGFTLLEVMLASTLSLVVLAGALTVGVSLQRRGLLEERTMETQNAVRSARDILVPVVQRAGAGIGKARLNVGGNGVQVDQRYAVWVTTDALFEDDPTFEPPSGVYEDLISDSLEIWDADSTLAVQLSPHADCGGSVWNGNTLCAYNVPDEGLAPGSLSVVTNPEEPTACVGVVGAARSTTTLAWTSGVPGRPLPVNEPCFAPNTLPAVFTGKKTLLMPLSVRAYRVNWASGEPVLEMDPDGSAGPGTFQPVARDIERLKVRLGLYNPSLPNQDVSFFPDEAAGRPGVDQCTNATCATRIPGDAGTLSGSDVGERSARDELMRRVRQVELSITARTNQADREVVEQGANGTTMDEEGNPHDGFKRRHFIQRIQPRNFSYSGG